MNPRPQAGCWRTAHGVRAPRLRAYLFGAPNGSVAVEPGVGDDLFASSDTQIGPMDLVPAGTTVSGRGVPAPATQRSGGRQDQRLIPSAWAGGHAHLGTLYHGTNCPAAFNRESRRRHTSHGDGVRTAEAARPAHHPDRSDPGDRGRRWGVHHAQPGPAASEPGEHPADRGRRRGAQHSGAQDD